MENKVRASRKGLEPHVLPSNLFFCLMTVHHSNDLFVSIRGIQINTMVTS